MSTFVPAAQQNPKSSTTAVSTYNAGVIAGQKPKRHFLGAFHDENPPDPKELENNPDIGRQTREDFLKRMQRTLAKEDVTFEEFRRYLFAVLYGSNDGFDNPRTIAWEMYKLSKEPGENGKGIDAVAFAKSRGYLCLEHYLESDELSSVVNVEVQQYPRDCNYAQRIVYRYALTKGVYELYENDPLIRKQRMKRYNDRLIPTMAGSMYELDEEEEEEIKKIPKQTEVKGEIFSYLKDEPDSDDRSSSGLSLGTLKSSNSSKSVRRNRSSRRIFLDLDEIKKQPSDNKEFLEGAMRREFHKSKRYPDEEYFLDSNLLLELAIEDSKKSKKIEDSKDAVEILDEQASCSYEGYCLKEK